MNRFVTFGSAVGRPLLMAWVAATFMLSPLVSGAGVGVEWTSGRSADGRFFQLSFEASLGDLYTIESSHDLEDWTAEATYWGLGQTIRYAIYQYSGEGSELGDPVVSNPGIVFATLQISKVAGGGILLGWPSLQPGSSAEPAHHYLASAVLEGEWPDLGAGVYGNYHITYRCLGSVLEQVPEPLSLGAEDAAFASQFLASLPEMNAVAGTPAERIASVVATGLGEDSFCYYRIRRHYNLDSDGDGLSNKAEIEIFGTNWLFPDSNFDGISDSYQLHEALKQQFDAELAKKADIVDGRLLASQVPARTYLLLGQSNALGNAAITGSDNTARPSIQIFDRDAGEFVNWDILNPVPGMVARENFAYRLAQQLEKVGVNSRFVACAVSGASIASFLPNTGSSMLRLEADLKAAGMPGIDGVIWMQGETDGYARMSAATYKGHFEAIKRHLGEILGNNQIPWVVGELAAGLHSQDSKNLVFDSYAADPLVRVMPNRDLATLDGVHFTGESLVEMGSMAFAAINGSARTSSDPILYQQWAEKTVDLGGIKITDFGNSTHDTGSGYLRMNVHGDGAVVPI